ncbi:hypothetical protein BDV41DRAFT_590148 [Aspergillus transmontanensis]|uniref:Piwi domain-containing protein n=1 Tax=Aspergillus transmontanensis TaxID=1034304 RepID=A0A5N6WC38_9EURO|nr:hypothetical protein BDV41DRAFT_590148 [Aspergillus transmontanensis]
MLILSPSTWTHANTLISTRTKHSLRHQTQYNRLSPANDQFTQCNHPTTQQSDRRTPGNLISAPDTIGPNYPSPQTQLSIRNISFRGFRDNPPQRGKGGPTRPQGRGGAKTTIYLPLDGKIPPPNPTVRQTEDGIHKAIADPLTLRKLQLNSEYLHDQDTGPRDSPSSYGANYLNIIPDSNLILYRYAVDVRPSASGRKLAQIVRLVLEAPELSSVAANLVADFKSTIISREKLPLTNNAIIVPVLYRSELEDEPAEDATQYKARILYTNTLRVSQLIEYLTSTDLNQYNEKLPMPQALNILSDHYPMTSPDLVSRGRTKTNRTFPLGNKAPLSDKAHPIYARLAACRVLVNVNISHVTFFNSGRPIDLIDTYQKANCKSLTALNEFLHGIRGRTLHLRERRNRSGELIIKPKTIHSLARRGDGTDLPLNRKPGIQSFGAGSKGIKFWLGSRQAPASGPSLGPRKKWRQQSGPAASPAGLARLICVYDYFLETYNIRDQRPDLPTQDMIKFAVRLPLQNAFSIVNQGADTVGLNPERNILLVSSYHEMTIGSWNITSTKFNVPGQRLRKCSYLLFSDKKVQDTFRDVKSLQPVVQKLQAALIGTGVPVNVPLPGKIVRVDKDDTADLDNTLRGAANSLDRLYIILPDKDSRWYSVMKRLCDVQYGLQTICSVAPKLVAKKGQMMDQYGKSLDQYMRNLAMKFNLKLGGTNHVRDNLRLSIINEDKTMIVGLDVTHPTGSQISSATAPSVAAMVASIDKALGQWPATIQVQSRGGKEEIDSLDGMFKRHLRLWKLLGKHASFPENIIVFRDGISEGQYTKCLTEELPTKMEKHHHEVFSQRYTGKFPPKYRNVAEIVQDLTLNLSYLVGRATKGVRVCCAARYADLVCDRARCYLSRFYEPSSETSSVASGASTAQATNRDVLVHEKIRNTMFYI